MHADENGENGESSMATASARPILLVVCYAQPSGVRSRGPCQRIGKNRADNPASIKTYRHASQPCSSSRRVGQSEHIKRSNQVNLPKHTCQDELIEEARKLGVVINAWLSGLKLAIAWMYSLNVHRRDNARLGCQKTVASAYTVL